MPRPDTFTVGLVLLVYVLPLALVSGLLAAAGLPYVALALLVVEAVVAGCVLLAKRPARADRALAPRWAVPVAFVAVLAALVGVAVLAARAG